MQPIKVPATSNEQYGGLEVTYSSTKLNSLADAFLHLLDYPYECNEQIASRILAVVALYDVLEVFGKVSSYEASQAITRDLEKLAKNQNSNGILYYTLLTPYRKCKLTYFRWLWVLEERLWRRCFLAISQVCTCSNI